MKVQKDRELQSKQNKDKEAQLKEDKIEKKDEVTRTSTAPSGRGVVSPTRKLTASDTISGRKDIGFRVTIRKE